MVGRRMRALARVAVLGFSVCASACDSACENANEKVEDECKDEIARARENQMYPGLPLSGGSEECNEDEECIAECINDTDCASLAWSMATGGVQRDPEDNPPDGVREFFSCLSDCDVGF